MATLEAPTPVDNNNAVCERHADISATLQMRHRSMHPATQDRRVRRLASRRGYLLHRSRVTGGYMLINPGRWVIGDHYSLTLDQAEYHLRYEAAFEHLWARLGRVS